MFTVDVNNPRNVLLAIMASVCNWKSHPSPQEARLSLRSASGLRSLSFLSFPGCLQPYPTDATAALPSLLHEQTDPAAPAG